MYTVNQVNNQQNQSDEDLKIMRKIYETIGYAFKTPLSTSDFQSLEMEHYEDYSAATQFFYLTAESGDIVSTVEIVPRKGLHDKTLNLLLTMVFTHQNYRKQGLIQKLIHWVIKYIETGDFNNDPSLGVSDSIKNCKSQEYIDSVIPKEIRDANNIHWSLYSIIGTFYKQFGFTPCDDINWFEVNSTAIGPKSELDMKDEKILTVNDIDAYYHDENLTFDKITDESFQNCALEESSYSGFVGRFQSFLDLHKDKFNNIEFFQNCGIKISDPETSAQTIVFLCPFFFMNRVVINRVYTDSKNKEIFAKQWEKALEFVYYYSQNVWEKFPGLSDTDKIIMVANNDFISKSNAISKAEFADVVTSVRGWENKLQGFALPMIRDWKLSKDVPSKLAHNGHWSFM